MRRRNSSRGALQVVNTRGGTISLRRSRNAASPARGRASGS